MKFSDYFKSFSLILAFYFLSFIVSIIVFSNFNNRNENSIIQEAINSREKKVCQGINPQKAQFKITLDNVTYPTILPLYHNNSIDFKCLNSSPTIKTILMWNKFIGNPLQNYGFGVRAPFERINCPVTNCELTNDRSKINASDLVLFHMRNRIDYIPVRQKVNQRFVQVAFESPINCHFCAFGKYEGVFNLSASYRSDSDFTSIYWTESHNIWAQNDQFDQDFDWHGSKPIVDKLVAILTSNCKSKSGRENFIKELESYLPLHVYGKCGSYKCPSPDEKCLEYIAGNYKFYLSFENSLCDGYVTEKFFNTISFDIVPVVFGLADYRTYVPKSGYINGLDFDSVKQLAEYLLYLESNKTAYNSYFKWKKYIKVEERKVMGGFLCEMCIQLQLEENLDVIKRKSLKSLMSIFGLTENCNNIDLKYLKVPKLAYSYYMNSETFPPKMKNNK